MACTNLHMIVNVLDKGCIWFSSAPKKDVEFCAIMVENDNSLRAYKVNIFQALIRFCLNISCLGVPD